MALADLIQYDPNILQRKLAQELALASGEQALQQRAFAQQLQQQLAPLQQQAQLLEIEKLQQALDPAFQEQAFQQKLQQAVALKQAELAATGPKLTEIGGRGFLPDPNDPRKYIQVIDPVEKVVNPVDAINLQQKQFDLEKALRESTPQFQESEFQRKIRETEETERAKVRGQGGVKGTKLSLEDQKSLQSASSQANFLPQILTDFKSLQTQGLTGPVSGRFQGIKSAIGIGEGEFVEARSQLGSNLFGLARALQGPGVLTDNDIKRMEDVMSNLSVTEDQFAGSLRGVAKTMLNKTEAFEKINKSRLDPETLQSLQETKSKLSSFINKEEYFASEAEARQAGKKSGDIINLGGRRARLK